jgi:hypothetical protein
MLGEGSWVINPPLYLFAEGLFQNLLTDCVSGIFF